MKRFKDVMNEAAMDLGSYALKTSERLTYLYKNDSELAEAIEAYDTDGMESKILFVFAIKQDMGLNVFDAVYAQKGYGPAAYKTAMTMMGSLAPVQDSRVTRSAQKIWEEFYSGKGSNGVTKELFGAVDGWQRNEYKLKKPLNLAKNKKAHEKFLGKDPYQEKIGMLDELADGLLNSKMAGIY